MYEYSQVINGIVAYIDEEIISKILGWKKWIAGSAVGIALSNATEIFNNVKENEYIKLLDIIDKDNRINVDKIYKEMKKQAKKGAITFDVPVLGALTLNEQDVEKIYNCIKAEATKL